MFVDGAFWHKHLRDAYRYFYPEEAERFVPEVVDFFAVHADVARGMPGAFPWPDPLKSVRPI